MLRVRGLFVPLGTLVLFLSEILLMSLAFFYAVVPVDGPFVEGTISLATTAQFALVLASLTIVAMVAVGLYTHQALLDYRAMVARIVLVFALEAPVIFAATVFCKDLIWPSVPPWSLWYFKAVLALFACLLTTRALFLLLADAGALKRRVVVIGAGERALRIKQLADHAGAARFVPAAFVAFPKDRLRLQDCAFTLDDAVDADGLVNFTRGCGANEIVVATDDRRGLPVRPLLGCKARGLAVTEFLSFCEQESGRVDLDALQPSWLIFSEGFRTHWAAQAAKRTFDFAISGAMLLLTLPLLVLTAAAIKLDDGGPVLAGEEHVGLFGKRFMLHKFRTVRVDAGRHGKPGWTARNDARSTRVGAVIRKLRIDELPQLFDVLHGDMSFIGPRPERPSFVERLAPHLPFYAERHAVKPGITGWAQINHPYGASLQDARDKLSYDLYYVKNHSLLLDLLILIQTVHVILHPEGAR